MTPDRELLYALFVQHLGYATASTVMEAGTDWVARREKGATMRELLKERGVLGPEQLKLVDALVHEALKQAHEDASLALRTLPQAMQKSLDGLSNTLKSGPHRTAAGEFRAGATLDERPDLHLTRSDSLENVDNIGQQAPGRYTFDTGPVGAVEELGRGGVGRVVVAQDHFLGRQVAVKELLREFNESTNVDTLQSSVLEARFLREARLTGQLEHPAVVPVFELGRRGDGTLYYAMQRVRGRTLAEALVDARSLTGRLAFLPDLVTVCRAVASAHHQGIIHRDLKPQNVMLGAFGETFLMDWGLARVLGRKDPHTRAVEMAPDITSGRDIGAVGTPSYMSPEQAFGQMDQVDERSDVWGLGAVLFELLTGRPPYIGKSPWDVVALVRSEKVPTVRSLEPAAPPELAAICERALQRERDARYGSVIELADDVQAWLDGDRVSVYDYTFVEVTRRILARNRVLGAMGAAALVGLVATVAVTANRVRVERDEAVELARFFLNNVAPTLETVPGAAGTVSQLMRSSLDVYRQGVDLESGPREERMSLVRAWNRLGHLSWTQGDNPEAERTYVLAEDAAQHLVTQQPDDAEALAELAYARVGLTDLAIDDGREGVALNSLNSLVELGDRAAMLAPSNVLVLGAQAQVYSRLADLRLNLGDTAAALAAAQRSVDIQERRVQLAPGDPDVGVHLVWELNTMGLAEAGLERDVAARTHLNRAYELVRELSTRSDASLVRVTVGSTTRALGRFEHERRNADRAHTLLLESRVALERVVQTDPADATTLLELSEVLLLLGETDAASQRAVQLKALGKEGEYGASLALVAFASGHDDLLFSRLEAASRASRDATVFYAAVAHALAGRTDKARALLDELPRDGMQSVVWLDEAVHRRLGTRAGVGPDAVRALAGHLATRPGAALLDATGVSLFADALGPGAGRGPR